MVIGTQSLKFFRGVAQSRPSYPTKKNSRPPALGLIFVFYYIMGILSISVALAADPCIDINTAPKEELEKIKHVGSARGEQIVRLRKEKLFFSVNELNRVVGIGPSRVSEIKEQGLACVSTTTVPTSQTLLKENLAEIKQEKPFNPLFLLLTASIIAIFSGFAILFLKRKIKKGR